MGSFGCPVEWVLTNGSLLYATTTGFDVPEEAGITNLGG